MNTSFFDKDGNPVHPSLVAAALIENGMPKKEALDQAYGNNKFQKSAYDLHEELRSKQALKNHD